MPFILKLASSLPCTCLSKRLLPLKLYATKSNLYSIPTDDHPHTDQAIPRRSADFKPTVWQHDYIQSLNKYSEESHEEQSKVARDEVRMILHKMEDDDTLHQLD